MNTIERIINLMEKRGINPFKIEQDLKLANGSVGQWKRGRMKPSTEALTKIADYFNVSVDYLLDRTDFPQIVISSTPNIDYSFLFVEDSYLALASLSHAIDFLNKAKETAITDTGIKRIEEYIQSAVHHLVDILTIASGGHRIVPDENIDIILKEGSKGFDKVIEKLGITNEQLDRLYRREKNIKKPSDN